MVAEKMDSLAPENKVPSLLTWVPVLSNLKLTWLANPNEYAVEFDKMSSLLKEC